jgi:hypothetical protein
VTLSRTSAVWASLLVAIALATVHLFAPAIRRRLPMTSHALASFGGGVAATYVFLYLLPRLAEGNQAVATVLGDEIQTSPIAALSTSLVALIGFLSFYALERLTHRSQRDRTDATLPAFAIQLGFFAVYSGLVTYTLTTKWEAGAAPALLFAVAMGLHIFAADDVLADHFPQTLTGRWRFVLAGGAGLGWLIAIVAEPTGTPMVNVLIAFLGGAILLNVAIDELPPERHSSFAWFVAGIVVYAPLLILATVAGKPGAA